MSWITAFCDSKGCSWIYWILNSAKKNPGWSIVGLGTIVLGVGVGRYLLRRRNDNVGESQEEKTEESSSMIDTPDILEEKSRSQDIVRSKTGRENQVCRKMLFEFVIISFTIILIALMLLNNQFIYITSPLIYLALKNASMASHTPLIGLISCEEDHEAATAIELKSQRQNENIVMRDEEEVIQFALNECKSFFEFEDGFASNINFSILPNKVETILHFPWEAVVKSLLNRYPDANKPNVSVRTIHRDEIALNSKGRDEFPIKVIKTYREIRTPIEVPFFARKMLSSDCLMVDERLLEISEKKFLRIQSVNRNFRETGMVLVISTCRQHPDDPNSTIIEQTSALDLKIASGYFKSQITSFISKKFVKEANENVQAIQSLCEHFDD